MASKRLLLIATALLLVLVSACAIADRDDDERYGTEWEGTARLSGIISDLDYGTEVFTIKDGRQRYTIVAEGVRVELRNGSLGKLRDLRDGMMIRVLGEHVSSSQIIAHTLIVLEDSGRFDNGRNTGEYYYDEQAEIDGLVTEVNTRARQIHVRSGRDNYVVSVSSATEIRRAGYLTGIGGVSVGDEVTVAGTPRGRGRIDARLIKIFSYDRDYRYDDRRDHRIGTVEGTITSTTSYFDRNITIRTSRGDVKVDVTKGADVTMDGRSVSIHGVTKGLWARAYGEWDGSTLVASRVDVYTGDADDGQCPHHGGYWPPRDDRSNHTYPQTRAGVISSIDTRRNLIKLDIGLSDMNVNTAEADVTSKGSKISLSRLQKGDKIQVSGDYSGDTLKARSIQVLTWAEEMGINDKW